MDLGFSFEDLEFCLRSFRFRIDYWWKREEENGGKEITEEGKEYSEKRDEKYGSQRV